MPYIDVRKYSLDDWLKLVLQDATEDDQFIRCHFPSPRLRKEYLTNLGDRDGRQVKMLLRLFLVRSGSNPLDEYSAEHAAQHFSVDSTEHQIALLRHHLSDGTYPVWEGLHWVIDLLPSHPRSALDALDAYFLARCQHLPDHFLYGLDDAKALIRGFYISHLGQGDDASRTLRSLSWRELEYLMGALYEAMGFDVTVTPRGNDDGVDVLAERQQAGIRDRCVVQVKKRGRKHPVEKKEIRELVGTMDLERATRGVLATTGRFRSGALRLVDADQRLDQLGPSRILTLLAEHCGADWWTRVDMLLGRVKRKQMSGGGLSTTVVP